MLPYSERVAFLVFAAVAGTIGIVGLSRVVSRIRGGRPDPDDRFDNLFRRLRYAIETTLTQSRTFQKRPGVSVFHAFIFYGFVVYLLVNLVDGLQGYIPFTIPSGNVFGATYNLCADIMSFLVLLGVVALVLRRFVLPSRHDFNFNPRTLLHPKLHTDAIPRDSLIVSTFILFHVGSRAVEAAAFIALDGHDRFQPFANTLSRAISHNHAEAIYIFGYWGALGSVLVFLSYFPYSKHLHIFTAPLNYALARDANSGTLPLVPIDLNDESQILGVGRMQDFSWRRLLDAYACIQCNRCQDVCPASVTGKALSPAALEINKRMELNQAEGTARLNAAGDPVRLLDMVISAEALWACTTCGACMQVCPVQDEQMLDIIDIRRNQVMVAAEFPSPLQTAFRGMERAKNPWGINHDKRLDWAAGLDVKTIDEHPAAEVLYWVGCAASYDPQAQKTARAFVQLLNMANVDFAVLGKKECCTGDSARRAGNEFLYQQLATQNISTLNAVKASLIVATCPHCLNSLANEYKQLGGNYSVMHHTQFLDSLVSDGRIIPAALPTAITYHDPCYLGRHNQIYDAPRNLLRVIGQEFVEMGRSRENSFCCGAGGAQFWKEEEAGVERISDNRFREAQCTVGDSHGTLAVGCPFCKSMLDSTPGKASGNSIVVKDIAELLLEATTPASPLGVVGIGSTISAANSHPV